MLLAILFVCEMSIKMFSTQNKTTNLDFGKEGFYQNYPVVRIYLCHWWSHFPKCGLAEQLHHRLLETKFSPQF
jgi:hypothetical protein